MRVRKSPVIWAFFVCLRDAMKNTSSKDSPTLLLALWRNRSLRKTIIWGTVLIVITSPWVEPKVTPKIRQFAGGNLINDIYAFRVSDSGTHINASNAVQKYIPVGMPKQDATNYLVALDFKVSYLPAKGDGVERLFAEKDEYPLSVMMLVGHDEIKVFLDIFEDKVTRSAGYLEYSSL
jgi:hypothetical protein